jgi:squalene-associated FAD-dependent desaturase
VFLRCCEEYLGFLDRIGAASEVELPDRLDIPVVAPGAGAGAPRFGRLRRSDLPAPLHLAGSLLRFPHLPLTARLGLGRAVLDLRRLDLADPALDRESFGDWLGRHGQAPATVTALWDLITIPTVNLRAADASLAMAAKVFQTGLLTDTRAADIGWSRVPLGHLHGVRAGAALEKAGVQVHLGAAVQAVQAVERDADRAPSFTVRTAAASLDADAVIMAVPHDVAGPLLPPDSVANQTRLGELGTSAIVDVHLVFDRPVTRWPLLAGLHSPIQWVFDRTASSGLSTELAGHHGEPGHQGQQYVAVSVSAADELLGRRPDQVSAWIATELARLLPEAAGARVLDAIVTKERHATFRAAPGTAPLRPAASTAWPGLAVAGAWTDTGWPATMEGAVRSGRAAAGVVCAAAGPPRAVPVAAGSATARSTHPIPRTEEVA